MAICTWNRADLLRQTLDRLAETELPPGTDWEVVVVDNGSTDATQDVLADRSEALPLVARLEPTRGHSHARNHAVAVARGELILWTDDDVLVEPDWVANVVRAANDRPEALAFGGPVRPWFAAPPPAWVRDALPELGHCWALVDHGPETRDLAAHEYAYGASLATRKVMFGHYRFDPGYGRVGDRLSSGDDTRLQDALRAGGNQVVWVGDAAVRHYLPAERMTIHYVRQIAFWAGFHGHGPFADDAARRALGVPLWLVRKAVAASVRARLRRRRDRAWAVASHDSAKLWGLIARFRRGMPS